jgi:hypothetical protein
MTASEHLLRKLLIWDIVLTVLGVISAIISAVALPGTDLHFGHLITLLGALASLVIYIVAITMLFLGRYSAWKLYLGSIIVAAIFVLPSGYTVISSLDQALALLGATMGGVIICLAATLDRQFAATERPLADR